MNISTITFTNVRQYLVSRYAEEIRGIGRNDAELPDSFDFLLEGIIDSLGVLEMICGLEKEFGLALDMEFLDAEEMTVLGPLARYVEAQAELRSGGSEK